MGWDTRKVEYLDGNSLYNGSCLCRFTKLRALNLTEFSSIVLIDTNLLVRGCIGELFRRPAPSGMRRHVSAEYEDGELIPSAAFVDKDGYLKSGINAGVMVLKPCVPEFDKMCEELKTFAVENQPRCLKSGMPEQDYLTRLYNGRWRNFSVCYNSQPHQIACTDRRGLENCYCFSMDYEQDLKIVHFSAPVNPRDFLLDSKYANMKEMDFAEEVFCRDMNGYRTDR